MSTESLATSNTSLYVKNIPSKIKPPEVRAQLYALFSTYGPVRAITRPGRGQAFVVFAHRAASAAALTSLRGFSFYGRPLHIEYARTQSAATVVATLGPEALFDPAVKATMRPRPQGGPQRRTAGEERARDPSHQEEQEGLEPPRKRPRGAAETEDESHNGGDAAPQIGNMVDDQEAEMQLDEEEEQEQQEQQDRALDARRDSGQALDQPEFSTSKLLALDLPPEITQEMLEALFSTYVFCLFRLDV